MKRHIKLLLESYHNQQGVPIIALTGNGVTIANGDATPSTADHTDYGVTNLSTTVTRTFTITNSGNADLTGLSVSAPDGYTVTVQPSATLAPAAQTTFSVRFDATLAQTYSGNVTIGSNELNDFTFAVTARAAVATFTVATTAPNQTLTITSFGISESTNINWGDSSSNDYTGTAQRTHLYASAGTYTVTINKPLAVTTFDIRDSKVTLNSVDIADMVNITTFTATTLKAGTFDSTDVSAWRPAAFQLFSMPSGYAGTFDSVDVGAWRPTTFQVQSMPSGYTGTFNSVDVGAWRPTTFILRSMPSGYTGTFNSVDVVAWRPTNFQLFSMPSGYNFTITDDTSFAGWTTCNLFQMLSNNLTQAQVDTILYSLYVAATSRTATNGTINVGGSNAAPSGTYQAAASCPVTTSTPGKEVAHELVNDGCAVITNQWATVTFTA